MPSLKHRKICHLYMKLLRISNILTLTNLRRTAEIVLCGAFPLHINWFEGLDSGT